MDKYVKKWVEWCDSCGHGFKINAGGIESTTRVSKMGFIGKLLGRKPDVKAEVVKPEPSKCPVCGFKAMVTVIKLQEDKIAVPDSRS